MEKVLVKFRISEPLLKAVDSLLEGKKTTRTSFIIEAIEAYYHKCQVEEAERELAALYPEGREISLEEEAWINGDLTLPLDEKL